MPNTEEQEKITIEISPIGNGDEATNTPETIRDTHKRRERHLPRGLLRWSE